MSPYVSILLPAYAKVHRDGLRCAHNCALLIHGCCNAGQKPERLRLDNTAELYYRTERCKADGRQITEPNKDQV